MKDGKSFGNTDRKLKKERSQNTLIIRTLKRLVKITHVQFINLTPNISAELRINIRLKT